MSMFPHTVTLCHAVVETDPDTLADVTTNHITVLRGVLLDTSKGRSIRGEYPVSTDKVTLYVPFTAEGMPDNISPDGKTFFIKGEVLEPDLSADELYQKYRHVYAVTSVAEYDYGGLQHWEIGGK